MGLLHTINECDMDTCDTTWSLCRWVACQSFFFLVITILLRLYFIKRWWWGKVLIRHIYSGVSQHGNTVIHNKPHLILISMQLAPGKFICNALVMCRSFPAHHCSYQGFLIARPAMQQGFESPGSHRLNQTPLGHSTNAWSVWFLILSHGLKWNWWDSGQFSQQSLGFWSPPLWCCILEHEQRWLGLPALSEKPQLLVVNSETMWNITCMTFWSIWWKGISKDKIDYRKKLGFLAIVNCKCFTVCISSN